MSPRVLVYGYGNPGRLDDGLGPALVRELSRRGLRAEADLETAYQLQVEDAARVAEYDLVIFADAAPASTSAAPRRPGCWPSAVTSSTTTASACRPAPAATWQPRPTTSAGC